MSLDCLGDFAGRQLLCFLQGPVVGDFRQNEVQLRVEARLRIVDVSVGEQSAAEGLGVLNHKLMLGTTALGVVGTALIC